MARNFVNYDNAQLMTVKDYAKREKYHVRTIQKWIQLGKIRAVKSKGKWLVIPDSDHRKYQVGWQRKIG